MTAPNWRVTIAIGVAPDVVAWDFTDQDDDDGYTRNGLTMTRKLFADKPWPAGNDIATASFSVFANDAFDPLDPDEPRIIDRIVRGAPVSINYFSPRDSADDNPAETFDGRVSDVTWTPHKRGGAIIGATCVDYTADLLEIPLQWEERDQETMEERYLWYSAQAETDLDGVTITMTAEEWIPGFGGIINDPTVAARPTATGQSFYAWLIEALDVWAQDLADIDPGDGGPGEGYGRYYLRQLTGLSSDPDPTGITAPRELARYELAKRLATVPDTPLPIDACTIDLGATWARRKGIDPNRIDVLGTWTGAPATAWNTETPIVIHTIESELVFLTGGERAANMYLPASGLADWALETFTWYLSEVGA